MSNNKNVEVEDGKGSYNPLVKVPVAKISDDKCQYDRASEENTIFCKLCSTRFTDFKEIIYLDKCAHCFCRNDIKKLIFQYIVLYYRELPKQGCVKCPECKAELIQAEIIVNILIE